MCYPVKCSVCGKTTWAGCGQHVDQVMRDVPEAQRCPGHDSGAGAGPAASSGFFARLFSR